MSQDLTFEWRDLQTLCLHVFSFKYLINVMLERLLLYALFVYFLDITQVLFLCYLTFFLFFINERSLYREVVVEAMNSAYMHLDFY
jgi:hypothetical protein